MLSQYDDQGRWIGCLRDEDVAKLDLSKAVYLTGPGGLAHAPQLPHAARLGAQRTSDLGRPLLLYTLTSADAFPYTVNPIKPKHDQYLIRGKRARVRAPRSAAVPDPAGLVGRLHVDLRAAAGGRRRSRRALTGGQPRPARRLIRASSRRSSASIAKPTMPIAIMPAMTIDVLMLLCPFTIR